LRRRRSRRCEGGGAQFALYLSLILAELRAVRKLLERAVRTTPVEEAAPRETPAKLTITQSSSPGDDGDLMALLREIEDL